MAKILIVDDEPDILSALSRFFVRSGHDVLRAATGEEAVMLVQSERPAVVLLDLFLPDISGFEVLERTREVLGSRPFVAGAFVGDAPGSRHDREAYLRQI